MEKVGIIGAGIGGMCTAIRLAVRGNTVTVFEANDYVGGKLTAFEQDGFRFDAGPSLFTMPQYLEELFALAGKSFSDYCPYDRLDPITHYFYPDGTRLIAYADAARFAKEMEEKLGVDAALVEKKLQHSARLYDLTADLFLHSSLHKLSTYTPAKLIKAGTGLGSLGLFTTMHKANEQALGNSKAVQLFDRYATYNGSDPYQAPGTLNIIPHLEFNVGAYLPHKGMHAITQALYHLAEELGVSFYLGEKAEEIVFEGEICTGIRTAIGLYPFDLVVSNMDIVPTYRKLLPELKAPESTLQQPRSSSALIFYWGIKSDFPELGVHNIFFSADYRHEFDCLFRQGMLYNDPTVYINITAKKVPGDAPAGHENWFVMVNAPNNTGQDWDSIIQTARQNVLMKLSGMLGRDIQPLIRCESILDPRSIEAKTGSYLGALYGSSSNNRMAAFLRHANFSRKIKNLYFCGGSVHPGGGIPLCVLSAKIVDGVIHGK
jgi:diapolycopene oxygenase